MNVLENKFRRVFKIYFTPPVNGARLWGCKALSFPHAMPARPLRKLRWENFGKTVMKNYLWRKSIIKNFRFYFHFCSNKKELFLDFFFVVLSQKKRAEKKSGAASILVLSGKRFSIFESILFLVFQRLRAASKNNNFFRRSRSLDRLLLEFFQKAHHFDFYDL